MRAAEQFREHIWLIEFIRRRQAVTLKDIQDAFERTSMYQGLPLTRASFNRHREVIEEVFGIRILCNRKNGYRYTLEDGQSFQRSSIQDWLVSTLSVSAAVSQNKQLEGRILLEMIPSAGSALESILEAMNKSVTIRILHKRYGITQPQEREIEPYCVKLWDKRWYVLGRLVSAGKDQGSLRLYSLDRIQSLNLTGRSFRIRPDFSCQDYFKEYFGVLTKDDVPLEKVLLRAYGNTRYYLRDLPLHPSQEKVFEGKDYVDYELALRPTPDFVNELLAYGSTIQVLSPKPLLDQIRKALRESLALYD